MPDEPSAEQIVSAADLDHLAGLFIQVEGASDPRATTRREAAIEFCSMIDRLFEQKIAPSYHSVSRAQFRSFMRRKCRERATKSVRLNPAKP